jgi:DIS3-like exonuclease 2
MSETGKKRPSKPKGKGPNQAKQDTQPRKGNSNQQHKKSNNNNNKSNNSSKTKQAASSFYPPHDSYESCSEAYATYDPTIVRGKLRVLPSGQDSGSSFVTDDRGIHRKDIVVIDALARNRALDGDLVFIRLDEKPLVAAAAAVANTSHTTQKVFDKADDAGDEIVAEGWGQASAAEQGGRWQDDEIQMELWNPLVSIDLKPQRPANAAEDNVQRQGKVVYVHPPARLHSELGTTAVERTRPLVGYIKVLTSGTALLTPLDKSLPQFKVPPSFTLPTQDPSDTTTTLYKADFCYDWEESHKWPPCRNVVKMGQACVLEDEIQALLMQNRVDHGDFAPEVLRQVDESVQSGLLFDKGNMEWKPTPDMYKGRRDYTKERIFTIDPTTARDLDDALHIKQLPDGRIEVGVHIADVSHFVTPGSAVDAEAQRRTTTVYLVDRVIPMLPRPLCEIACSLNENVERLAFSCVWTMNANGSLGKDQSVWYGRTVIRSCARLDYATAQNIIEDKVATGEMPAGMDEALWPPSRRPDGEQHTVDEVAADVRLMHRVAMARRRLRFANGALALNGPKLTFQLDADGQTPLLAEPYPIRDSNRLVEEFMLLANYLVAQKLITHAKERAVLRHHPEPIEEGLDKVQAIAKAAVGFDMDISSSRALHATLQRFGRECEDPLVMQCVTQMLMIPMQPANYFAAGTLDSALWKHFGLNIPYYTHFTSPIRRYPDVLVHRLLQATLDEENDWDNFSLSVTDLQAICQHCNEKRMAAKAAQERCDRVFLSLFVRARALEGQLGVVLSVGSTAFTVYVPSLGAAAMLYLREHEDMLTYEPQEDAEGQRSILLEEIARGEQPKDWRRLEIRVFTKLRVKVVCQEKPPIDVKVKLEGRWEEA